MIAERSESNIYNIYIYMYINIRPHQTPFPIFFNVPLIKVFNTTQTSSPEFFIEIGADFRVPPYSFLNLKKLSYLIRQY